MAHWTDAYIGLPYIEEVQDCAEVVARVQREVFGRLVTVPGVRAEGPFGKSAQIAQGAQDLADPVADPLEGDVVLMQVRGLWHVGVLFYVDEPWVLHALRSSGQVVSHRLRELAGVGVRVEGYYRMRCDG